MSGDRESTEHHLYSNKKLQAFPFLSKIFQTVILTATASRDLCYRYEHLCFQ